MLIKLSRETWVNFTCDNVNRIDIIKPDDQLQDEGFIRYYVMIDTNDENYYSDNFQTFEAAEAFAFDIVNKLNAEAQHETK